MALQTELLAGKDLWKLPLGDHNDGGGLYLIVTTETSRRWQIRYTWQGKLKKLGYGALRDRPADEARDYAAQVRRMVRDGKDPSVERPGGPNAAARTSPTFIEFARMVLAKKCAKMKNEKAKQKW